VLASKMSESLSTEDERHIETPLPSEDEIESMLTEIRQLEQEEIQTATDFSDDKPNKEKDPLKQVLSSIPSFSEMNK
jgi:hypothetical protein